MRAGTRDGGGPGRGTEAGRSERRRRAGTRATEAGRDKVQVRAGTRDGVTEAGRDKGGGGVPGMKMLPLDKVPKF